MNDTHSYEVNLQWNYDTKGTLSSPALPNKIEVATPPDFPKGMAGIWSPEHLFVASVNACLMATFLAIADNSKIEFISFQSDAIGKVEKIDGKYSVTEIVIEPKLVIPSTGNEEKVRRIFEMSEKACAISNSIKSKISLLPVITTR
jgi:organic hydroperoxide reductase OsmC/OhrA